MELYRIYVILIGIVIVLYGIPFYLVKSKKRVYLTLIIGTMLFYLFSGVFVFLMDLYSWDNGEYPFFEEVALALFVSLPFILIVNLVLAFFYYAFRRWIRPK